MIDSPELSSPFSDHALRYFGEFDWNASVKDHAEMIDGLKIENFRGFPLLEIPKLTKFTILGGGNNVGKTSVLEALFFFASRLNPMAFIHLHTMRGIVDLPMDPSTLWAPFFWKHDLSRVISISPNIGGRTDSISISFKRAYTPIVQTGPGTQGVPTVQASFPNIALSVESKAGETVSSRSHLVMTPTGIQVQMEIPPQPIQVPLAFIHSRSVSSVRDDALRFGTLDVNNKVPEILDFIKIVEPRLKGLSAVAVGNGTVMHGELIDLGVKMPIYNMGDGVVRFLGIILAIASCRNGIVLIDELGTGFHYSILSRVCEAIAAAAENYNVQVIATTHSYEFLKELHKGVAHKATSNFSYVRLDYSDENYTAKMYDYEMVGAALEQGLELR